MIARRMLASLRFIYVLLIPVAGSVILSLEGVRIAIVWAFLIVIGVFVYQYLQAALIATERKKVASWKGAALMALPLLFVGVASSFQWRDWIVEQMLLEAGAFSLGVAIVAIAKGAGEGRSAPWFLIVVVFFLPALGMVVLAGKTVLLRSGDSFVSLSGLLVLAAFVLAVWDASNRLAPYVAGKDQLEEPIQKTWHMVFVVVWLLVLLIGLPFLLSGAGH